MNEAEITCGGCGRTYKARWDGRVIVFERGHDAERPAPCSEESKGRAGRFYDAWCLRYSERPIGERFIVPHSYEAMFRLMDEYASASTNFRQSSSPMESGAESTGLRKENIVDKKVSAETGGEKAAYEAYLERRIIDLSLKVWEYGAYIGDWEPIQAQTWRAEADVIERKLYANITGLASLRGLKHKQFPNFPRSSQNQTVSSGVEGAHEGTTADKSGSREPEKLNNAQYVRGLLWKLRNTAKSALRDAEREADAWLAESSLSSPPPSQHYLSVERRKEAVWDAVRLADHAYDDATVDSQGMTRPEYIGKAATKAFYADYGAASPALLPTQLPKDKA